MPKEPAAIRIAIVATSSAVPQVELRMGIAHLRAAGMVVDVQERAQSFYAAASSNDSDVLWCACGGYGSARILPLLDRLTSDRGTPDAKLLVGFSDATTIMSFVRQRWGWATAHAPMVISKGLREMAPATLQAIARQDRLPGRWPLRWIGKPPDLEIEAEMIGGNLSVWNSLTGTSFAESAVGRMLFLEDVDEPPYRIDRMVTQLRLSGRLDGVVAIVLGGFTDCEDRVSQVMSADDPERRVPLRRSFSIDEALERIFGELGIPVAVGLPVGHGGNTTPLVLGVNYLMDRHGILTVT
jgi:muramoyltetrapeptide carboxypeptidase